MADPRHNSSELILGPPATIGTLLQLLIVVGRALALGLRGHRDLVLENLALRQQLMAMKRANGRPLLQARDRLFWIALRRIWTNWRSAIVNRCDETASTDLSDWRRRPDLNRGWRFCRFRQLLYPVDSSCSLVLVLLGFPWCLGVRGLKMD